MYNKGKIITGLVIFVVFFTSPFLYGLVKTSPAPEPELSPKAKAAKVCVENTEFMKESHMQLLNTWRNEAVRLNKYRFVATDGKDYVVSLQNTCLGCHNNKSKFCDQCHNYAGVNPYCWECHIEPKEK